MTLPGGSGKKPEPDTLRERREARLRRRAFLWDLDRGTREHRVARCGRVRVAPEVSVSAGAGNAHLGGLETCGSVWACPVCSAKVAEVRSTEVRDTIRAWRVRGGSVALLTLTLSHSRGHRLADTWDAITRGWTSVRSGRGWVEDRAKYGIAGFVRVVEVTHGSRHGWHPHVHVLLFLDRENLEVADLEPLRQSIFGRWSRSLARSEDRKGRPLVAYRTLDRARDGSTVGADLRVLDAHGEEYVAEYLAKFGYAPAAESGRLAREVGRGDLKVGRRGSRTAWQILDAAAGGDVDALPLWDEYERASAGRRQYAWSDGFRESLDLDALQADDALAAAEPEDVDPVVFLPASTWSVLVSDLRARGRIRGAATLLGTLLDLAATRDPEVVHQWLTDQGLDYRRPPAAPVGAAAPAFAADAHVRAHRRTAFGNHCRQTAATYLARV